ncbi:MAG: glycosyltransferase [Thermodesulfobacteriota bacterium]|nr:glycosyltransferase [Thermodesulfobacteriota bacterium]
MNDSRKADKTTQLEEYKPDYNVKPEDYTPYIGEKRVEELKSLAEPLEGKGWANVNSTLMGGGVAEMLRSVIPLARGLGIEARWHVIKGSNEFFQVTKKFHNMLQGVEQPITLQEIFGAYLNTINENAKNTFIVSDMVVIHDPQPAAMIMNGVIFGNVLWRCHIDTSSPDQTAWRFLLPYINYCAGAIFTMSEFIGPGLQIPCYQIAPSIDPMVKKNHQYSDDEALQVLSPLFHKDNIDPERPILAAISRYDIHKNQSSILKAFKRLRQEKKHNPPPYLIFLGNTATDDPEGDTMLERLREEAGDDPDIRFWVNVEDNDMVVGSLMHLARAFIHVSTREGFGLVVSEALWQGTPVIGSRVGGIMKQVLDSETGYLVNPLDSETMAAKMGRVLDYPEEAVTLGKRGKEHVRRHFLLPELVRNYLILLGYYTGASRDIPPFRLDELSYSEVIHGIRLRHPYVPDPLQLEENYKDRNILSPSPDGLLCTPRRFN